MADQALDPEDAAFHRLWGEWDALDPAGLAEFMAEYRGEWWVVGGWALEAFTHVPRRHDDIDLVIWRRDVSRAPPGGRSALAA